MKAKILTLVLAALLVLMLVLPVAAVANHHRYTVYGENLRSTYGASLGYNNPLSPDSYGSRLRPGTTIAFKSYGVGLGFYNLQDQPTYGSRLTNRSGNPNVVPYRPGNASVNVTNW